LSSINLHLKPHPAFLKTGTPKSLRFINRCIRHPQGLRAAGRVLAF
jgi:hypothetical protein